MYVFVCVVSCGVCVMPCDVCVVLCGVCVMVWCVFSCLTYGNMEIKTSLTKIFIQNLKLKIQIKTNTWHAPVTGPDTVTITSVTIIASVDQCAIKW